MDAFQVVVELKEFMQDYGVVFPYDPYGALNLEETIAKFLEKHFDHATDSAYDLGFDEGLETGYNDGYRDAENEFS